MTISSSSVVVVAAAAWESKSVLSLVVPRPHTFKDRLEVGRILCGASKTLCVGVVVVVCDVDAGTKRPAFTPDGHFLQ